MELDSQDFNVVYMKTGVTVPPGCLPFVCCCIEIEECLKSMILCFKCPVFVMEDEFFK